MNLCELVLYQSEIFFIIIITKNELAVCLLFGLTSGKIVRIFNIFFDFFGISFVVVFLLLFQYFLIVLLN